MLDVSSEGVLGTVLAAVFGAFAIFAYFRPRKTKRIRYVTHTVKLVEGLEAKVDDLKVLYKGSPVSTISVSTLVLWNSGTETIRDEDVTDDRLRVEVDEGVDLLSLKTTRQSHATNMFQTSGNEVEFDYVDPGEGAVLQLIHTGTRGSETHLRGRLQGAGRPKRTNPTREWVALISMLLALGGFVLALSLGPFVTKGHSALLGWMTGIGVFGACLLVAVLLANTFYRPGPRELRANLPAGPGDTFWRLGRHPPD
jgi:hypothetical protein